MTKADEPRAADMIRLDGVAIDGLLCHHSNVELRVRLIIYGHNDADTEFVVIVTAPDGTKESAFDEWADACEGYLRELGCAGYGDAPENRDSTAS